MLNVLTFDVEDWYHTNDFNIPISEYQNYEDRVLIGSEIILDLLDKYNTKATFFILGCVAEKHPQLVKKIAKQGHEVASHGYWHRMVSSLTPDEFRLDLRLSMEILQNITGQQVVSYRAPSWSISVESLWVLEIMEQEGILYDSSLQPIKTPLSGITGAPIIPYRPIVAGRKLELIEFPPTVLPVGPWRIPCGGGLYFRILPTWMIRLALSVINKERPALVYAHPSELDIHQPRLDVSPLIKFVHYYNLHTTKNKLENILECFRFTSLKVMLKDLDIPSLPVVK